MTAQRSSAYWLVYLVLALITALEIWITTLGLAQGLQTPILLALSLLKASLVAAFYMHLRSDSRLYLLVFLLPVLMVVGFGLVTLVR
jgi:cytochrome c oxidase subunit 4